MSRSDMPSPENQNYRFSEYEMPQFNSEVFYERATGWGATPLRHIPEQSDVCDMLAQRIDDAHDDSESLAATYMRTVYLGRFHVRQARNYSAYMTRLNQTPYEQLSLEVRGRSDRSMVGMASIKDELFLQDDYQMGSNELARKTHPNQDISSEYEDIEAEIYEACVELDPDTYVPDSKDRVKIRGSDIITIPVLKDGSDPKKREARLLFVTRKRTIAVMPRSDTVVVRRENYQLDVDEFALFEPNVAKVLRSYDVKQMGPDAWCDKLTEIWRDTDAIAPLINDQTRRAFSDFSTTYYTVNKFRLELIRMRDEKHTPKQPTTEPDIIQTARDAHKARQNGMNS